MWEAWFSVDNGELVVELAGSLTSETVAQLGPILEGDVRLSGSGRVRISLAQVCNADPIGIAMLRRCRARARMRGMEVRITDIGPPVMAALRASPGT
jgi:ABC-type transporter Mla MlaB component